MPTAFNKLNDGWNAEPNAPDPYLDVKGTDVILEFLLNPYQFEGFSEGQLGQLRFLGCRRYRLGPTNDEGWYRGQCRFSGIAPAWGRHFLFYFRDATFECDAAGYVLDLIPSPSGYPHER